MNVLSNQYVFRANPNYDAIPYNRLSEKEREALIPWRQDAEGFGILNPKPGHCLPVMAISRDTALIFYTLQAPGQLPDYIHLYSSQENQPLISLILDRVLEVLSPDGYVSGPEALSFFGLKSELSDCKLMHLSYRAVRYAQDLALDDPVLLSLKLYLYNQLPVTRFWLNLLPDKSAMFDYLNLRSGQLNERILNKYWQVLEGNEGWIFFRARTIKAGLRGMSYKKHKSGSFLHSHCRGFPKPLAQ